MRLHRIELTRYGAFEGKGVDIGPGLTVVLGPNESGKSTLRNAIGDLLWGIAPRSHPYAFHWSGAKLALAARCSRAPGDPEFTLTVTARGYLSDALSSPFQPWWREGSVRSREAWEQALSLDLPTLRAGGLKILEGTSDLQELLFAARTGTSLRDARAALQRRADGLFKAHGGAKSVQVRQEVENVKAAQQAAAAAVSSASEVARLREAAGEAAAELAAAKTAQVAARQQLTHAQLLVRAWPAAAEVWRARSEQQQLRAQGRLLGADQLGAYAATRKALTALTANIAEAEALHEQLRERLAGFEEASPVLQHAPLMARLREERGGHATRVSNLLTKRSDLARLEGEIRALVMALAPGQELAGSALIPAASELLIPEDVAVALDRGADAVAAAVTAMTGAESEEEKARAQVAAREKEAIAAPTVAVARAERNARWAEISRPWHSGELPEEPERRKLAGAFEGAQARADQAADQARDAAEDEGKLAQARAQLAARQEASERARAKLAGLQAEWEGLLASAGIPAILDVAAWEVRRDLSRDLGRNVLRLQSLQEELATETAAAEKYLAEIRELAGFLQIEAGDPLGALEQAVKMVTDAEKNDSARELTKRDLAAATTRLEALIADRRGHDATLQSLAAEDDLAEVAARSRSYLDVQADEQSALGKLRSAAGSGAELESVLAELQGKDLDVLQAESQELEAAAEEGEQRHEECLTAHNSAAETLRVAEQKGDAARLLGVQVEATERLSDAAEDYLETRIMMWLLDSLLGREDMAADVSLLKHAASVAASLTSGRVSGFAPEQLDGVQNLRIEAEELAAGKPSELSEGTADQVFLALRLAGIREHQRRARDAGTVPLPVVLDDILVSADDARTRAALTTLLEEAADQQIILFTHHGAVAAAGRELGATVSELTPRTAPA